MSTNGNPLAPRITSPEGVSELSPLQRDVYAYVAGSERGVTAPEVADELDTPRTTVIDQLNTLVDEGLIQSEKISASVRLWYVELTQQWGDYELLTETEREYFRTGDTGGIPEAVLLDRIINGLPDYANDIPFSAAPCEEDVRLIAARGDVDTDAVDLSFLALQGILMEVDGESTPLECLFRTYPVEFTPDEFRRVRRRLNVKQQSVAKALAKEGSKTEKTYCGYVSRWEQGKKEPFSREDKRLVVEFLREQHRERYGPFDVTPSWL